MIGIKSKSCAVRNAKHNGSTVIAVFLLLFAGAVVSQNVNYARVNEPPTRPAFIPLPPGAVEARGWLLDYALSVRDNFSMTLDGVSALQTG